MKNADKDIVPQYEDDTLEIKAFKKHLFYRKVLFILFTAE